MGALPQSAKAVREMVLALEEQILLGRLYPRERLVEEQLASQFAVSRHVVRQVLAELEGAGLLVRGAGTGVTIREYTPEDVQQLYEMRELLEAEAARRIVLPLDASALATVRALAEDYAAAVAARDMRAVIRTNKTFHQAVYSHCRNDFLFSMIDQMAQRANLVRFSSSMELPHLERARDDHFRIVDALAGDDSDRLAAVCVAHIQPSRLHYLERRKLST